MEENNSQNHEPSDSAPPEDSVKDVARNGRGAILKRLMKMSIDERHEVIYNKFGLRRFCKMETLDVVCIYAYMRFLSENFSKSQEIIQFINPNSFGEAFPKKYLKQFIMDRLNGAKEDHVYFAPLNMGDHWVLVVIDYATMTVFWLDSLHRKPQMEFKFELDTGLKALVINGKRRPLPLWEVIKGPKQAGRVECGYFVLKFMRDLMQNPSKSIRQKMKDLEGKPTYDNSEILEVQHQFVTFIRTYIK